MKKNPRSESGIFNPRIFLAFILTSTGVFLALGSLAVTGENTTLAAATSGARIFVTTTTPKIGPIGTGGCSLQEAIYSAILHDSLDGGAHGIAIDATDPDHFITTECVMGTGNGDTIVLPTNGMFQLTSSLDGDAYNYLGPTATPMIFSTMTIEAYGATLQWTGNANSRLFAIGQATVKTPNGTASGTGGVTIRNAYIKGFHVKGGDGGAGGGGGGGLGAGGAIYVQGGTLVVENSTFDTNSAVGGNGDGAGNGGGGGGLSGNGGESGGGGARGNGGTAKVVNGSGFNGGGGGGTVFSGGNATSTSGGSGSGGYLCGGRGGSVQNPDAQGGTCAGGGGGGAGTSQHGSSCVLGTSGDGGSGAYGGGGGGGAANGGNGGFGGGGGAGDGDGCFGNGGAGGFGGGGGSGVSQGGPGPGPGGPFGGNADTENGGGGGALGGAIFNESGSVTIHNSTFYNNSVARGVGVNNGGDAGGAIFSFFGTLSVVNSTVSGNQSTGSGGGIVVYTLGAATFTLNNTIIANNGANECFFTGNVTATGAGNLIMSNGSGTQPFGTCPGVVTNVDPHLQSLQPPSVNGGLTPTMAIPIFSSAMGVADPTTSLPYDQRYADRPQADTSPRNGYDIGAFTVCRRYIAGLRPWFCSETHITPPSTTTLTMQVSPSGNGATNPAVGSHDEDVNSVAPVQAIPNAGHTFVNWTGNVADSANPSTTVTMNQAQTVTANFAALADFNGDGFSDYLLFNSSTQVSAVWYLHGTAKVGGSYGPTLPSGWTLVGVGDFDQSGGPDYLLLNPSTRQTAIWFLSNTTHLRGAYGPSVPAGWQLVTAADLNGDGKPDYIFFNPSTLQTAVWYLNGTSYVSGQYGPTLPAGWNLVRAVDFNADGKPDYLLFNPGSGQTAVWYLNGASKVGGAYGPTLPAGWTLIGASDFNADGKLDYLLFNPSTRQTAIWILNGLTVSSGVYGPTLPSGYTLIAP